MDEFIWQKAYGIDDAIIDQEHRRLFELANQVLRLPPGGQDVQAVRGAVVALYDYVKTHFAHEEAYMREINYPGLTIHRVLHETIIHEMNMMMRECTQLDSLVYRLKRLMKKWVIEHIQQADRQIGDFLRQQSREGGNP
ncbi:MAG: bacteriohemerythrin [Thermodesulfobacteriota bacterium]